MKYSEFKNYPKSTLYNLLLNSYSSDSKLTKMYKEAWLKFDDFVFKNLKFMNDCGFISLIDNQPIGFISWNPGVNGKHFEIGHNCIIDDCKNRGYGKQQLSNALEKIRLFQPKLITVKTGNTAFFKPAQKMYKSLGFFKTGIESNSDNHVVPEVVLYELSI